MDSTGEQMVSVSVQEMLKMNAQIAFCQGLMIGVMEMANQEGPNAEYVVSQIHRAVKMGLEMTDLWREKGKSEIHIV